MKTTKEILKDVYFDGFTCRLRDETKLNQKWISVEKLKQEKERMLKKYDDNTTDDYDMYYIDGAIDMLEHLMRDKNEKKRIRKSYN
jgi:hypothetical protein